MPSSTAGLLTAWVLGVGILVQLDRIVNAFQKAQDGRRQVEDDGVDRSAVLYVDDAAAAQLEAEQAEYAFRTGIVLGPGEKPPKVPHGDGL